MSDLLQRMRAYDQRHPLLWDISLAALVAAVCVNATPTNTLLGTSLLIIVHAILPLRRRHPQPVLWAVIAVILLAVPVSLTTGMELAWIYLAVWVLLFNTGLRSPLPPVAALAGVLGVGISAAIFSYSMVPALYEQATFTGAVLAMCAACYLLGLQIRSQREQAAAERREAAREAAVAERHRIAQEMHDIIGHNLSVITSLATGGSATVRAAPAQAVQAFDAIGEVSRSSVREVRRVLTVLEDDHSTEGATLSPQPGIADVTELVETVRTAGLSVEMQRVGELSGLSPGRQLTIYRILQEALTNTLRHSAPQAHCAVSIVRNQDAIDVSIVSDARIAVSEQFDGEQAGSGRGLTGMRERVEAYNGTLSVGPTSNGWKVHASIPATSVAC
ncbi:sensor histidine kinase [Nesterenkonia haasae]|uniref:sensor histidine kinase n=1 Tax=Nesterenkonia haasae TaxID=2587813 RepID=UPI001390D7A6|nr:histidine kinase [Nesterenkonia haasae]NDK31565.1 hypothetical protein [Nesterenkonia haasae]